MPFDAKELFWPPFGDLYDLLEGIKLDASSVDPGALKTTLQEYSFWLSMGLRTFSGPNEASMKILQTENELVSEKTKIVIDGDLRFAALAAGQALVIFFIMITHGF